MRRLTKYLGREARNEHGATMVFVAVTISILFGFTALGVDLSHMEHERGRVQHSADAAAFAVAYNCVSHDPARRAKCSPSGGQPAVDEFLAADSAGDTAAITNDLTPAAGHVTVAVDEAVNHYFAPVIGVNSSNVHATATAAWKYAVRSHVLPYAVSICQYMNTPYDTPVLLDGMVNDNKGTIKNWKKFTEADFDGLPASTWRYCDDGVTPAPDGVVVPEGARTIRDGMWFSEGNCSTNISNSGSTLDVHELVCGTNMSTNGAWKYPIPNGKIVTMAIYAPHVNWDYSGFCSDSTGHISKCPAFSNGAGQFPMFELEIVGFAAFRVMGCTYGQPAYHCGGADPVTQGLYGKFVTTTEPPPDTEYDEDAPDFGVSKVELVE